MGEKNRSRSVAHSRGVWLLLLPVLLASVPAPASAHILNVPSDQPDVKAAVTASVSGDTIVIAPGTYAGGAYIQDKVLTIASRFLTTGDTTAIAQTILSGDAGGNCGDDPGCSGNSVLEFGANAHGSAVIGLTLINGQNGVGSSSIVDVMRCRVNSDGDGLDYSSGAGGRLSDNLIEDNSDDGIDLNGQMNLTVVNNNIRNNGDDGIEFRLYGYNGAAVTIVITGNQISGNGEDGVQLIDYPSVNAYTLRIERNLFNANFNAAGLSAAIGVMPNGDTVESLVGAPMAERLYVIHNTFLNEKYGLVGGANVIALDNLFVNTQGSAVRKVAGSSIVSYGMFWNNGIDYETSTVDAAHMLHANPALNADGTLAAGSPAIDAGAAFYQWNGETVLNDPPGVYIGNAPDIGAMEYGTQANRAPTVSAGTNLTVTLPAQANLSGAVSDDGLPAPPSLKVGWSVVSAAGPMAIQDPDQVQTRASFTAPGVYLVRLTVSDGALSASDEVTITVLSSSNVAPVVNAGPDQIITLPADTPLHGTASDDGLPAPATLTTGWIKYSGPGHVTFQNGALADTRASFSAPGAYGLFLMASDGAMMTRDSVTITVLPEPNDPPVIDAGAPQTIELPSTATLHGSASDDGHPLTPGVMTTLWVLLSGPAAPTIQSPAAVTTVVTFPAPGLYVFRLTASDGVLSRNATTQVTVLPPNTAPVVNAGPDQTITLPADAVLNGTVTDDGQPIPPATVTTAWTKVSGPGTVTFQNASQVDTYATFSTPGTYVLRLSANDGALATNDAVQITVLPVVNLAPAVDAGVNQTVVLSSPAALAATVTDDGLPSPPGAFTVSWSKASGPGTVTFGNASAVSTSATFSVVGTYLLRLTANDGALTASDSVQIVVQTAPPPIERRIAAASDDTEEETTSGSISTNTSDIELVTGATAQIDGLRFTNVTVAKGTTITNAWIQFEADEAQSEVTNLVFQCQAADNASTFTTTARDVSNRPRTTAQATWSPVPWAVVGEQGANQRTGDLKTIIQEVVNRPGWVSGNAIAVIVSGTGHRTARSFETVPAGAALLHLEVGSGTPANLAPVVDAGFNRTITLPATAALAGSVSDDGLPNPPGAVSVLWTKVSGPGTVSFLNASAVSTSASFSLAGTYVLRLAASDGGLVTTDTVQITVHPQANSAPVVDAGPNQTITLPAGAVVSGSASDDGQPNPPGVLTVTWSKGSGPGTVNFQNPNALSTTAAFAVAGTYILRLTANDGALASIDSVQITVLPRPNTAPVVDAGANQTITLPAGASLAGTASDDGLPSPPGTFTVTWSKGSGPGTVSFGNASALSTSASFSVAGTYILRLTANDGALSTTDSVQVTVLSPNQAPTASAGPDQIVLLPADAILAGTAGDDGLPNPPGALTTTWSTISGPGPVTFQNANQLGSHATFTAVGVYLLRLLVSDSVLSASDTVQITVQQAASLDRRIATGPDDVEESATGSMNLTSVNLQLVFNATNQIDGLRFTGITIPKGATITTATIQFTSDGTANGATSLVLQAQASDNAPAFTGSSFNCSSRARTVDSVTWVPPAWSAAGAATANERTPEIKTLVQAIVNRAGWASGNALVIIVHGTGVRTAYTYDGSATQAALLHVEYTTSVPDEIAMADSGSTPGGLEDIRHGGGAVSIDDAGVGAVSNAPGRGARDVPAVMHAQETRVETLPVELSLRAAGPSPARGGVVVECALPDAAPATLTLHDIAGRIVASRDLASFGPGRHTIAVRNALPAGVYVARLSQSGHSRVVKIAVLP